MFGKEKVNINELIFSINLWDIREVVSVCVCIVFFVLRVLLGDCVIIVGFLLKYKSLNVSCKCVCDVIIELDFLGIEKIDVRLIYLGYVLIGSKWCKIILM